MHRASGPSLWWMFTLLFSRWDNSLLALGSHEGSTGECTRSTTSVMCLAGLQNFRFQTGDELLGMHSNFPCGNKVLCYSHKKAYVLAIFQVLLIHVAYLENCNASINTVPNSAREILYHS